MDSQSKEAFRQKLADLLANKPLLSEREPARGSAAGAALAEPRRPAAEAVANEPGAEPLPVFAAAADEFVPRAPLTWEATGLSESEIEALVLKYLLSFGAASGRQIADHIRLPFRIVEPLLRRAKDGLLLVYKGSAPLSDYVYEPTDLGFERARRYAQRCTYCGTAPVSLASYIASVAAQSVTRQMPRLAQLRKAFADLVVDEDLLGQIAQAVNSGMGLFLYGAPGNGKTSFAERIVKAFGESIWVPSAISVFGEIVRLYDPSNHRALPDPSADTGDDNSGIDRRWIRIQRPTIVVGGELTMESLELRGNPATGVSESPLQLKANGGTLVIDDFGRQRVSVAELLNRWIVPLEKRYDFLNLGNGRKVQVPFDQLIIFSTNLEPKHLVDEAFLRRIPYKIDVPNPSEEQFRQLFRQLSAEQGVQHHEACIDYLLERHYRATSRDMRFCHPRDLMRQVKIFCHVHDRPAELSREAIDAAVQNYFAMM